MSEAFSEIAASALLEAMDRPGRGGRRFTVTSLLGYDHPDEIFRSFLKLCAEQQLDREDVDIPTGSKEGKEHKYPVASFRTRAHHHAIIPYLVTPHPQAASGTNEGSAGFAATLRTQFLTGNHLDRILVIFDQRPVETVLSAAEDIAGLEDDLSFASLLDHIQHTALGDGLPPLLSDVRGGFQEAAVPTWRNVSTWAEFLDNHSTGDAAAAAHLYQLGTYIGDPELAAARRAERRSRLQLSARLRRQLDAAHRSQNTSFVSDVPRILRRVLGDVKEGAAALVTAAAGPFEIDYSQFAFEDLTGSAQLAPPLDLDSRRPIGGGAVTYLQRSGQLVVWIPRQGAALRVNLTRPAEQGDAVHWTPTGGEPVPAETTEGSRAATFRFEASTAGTWHFGWFQLHTSGGDPAEQETIRIPAALYFGDGEWFPVEDRLQLDPAASAFIVEDAPEVAIVGRSGRTLGFAEIPEADMPESGERQILTVTYEPGASPLPILLLGETIPEEPEEPGDPEGPEGGPPERDRTFRTIPEALAELRAEGDPDAWPETALVPSGKRDGGKLRANIDGTLVHVESQLPGGTDGASLEQEVLNHPEWLAYTWNPEEHALQRDPGTDLSSGGFDLDAVDRFHAARRAMFEAAKSAGSVYGLDPRTPTVEEYLASYQALASEAAGARRFRSEYGALLRLDTVRVGGQRDLLIAPTSPLSLAYHHQLAITAAGWTGDQAPHTDDIKSLTLRYALPLMHMYDSWYESIPCSGALWRLYSPLARSSPSVDHDARFIAGRLRFFLDVYPTYTSPDQTIAITFLEPGDLRVIHSALRSFYRKDFGGTEYTLPRLEIALVGVSEATQRQVNELFGAGRADDLDRLIQARATISAADDLPAFSHVTFAFRSPGERGARPIEVTERAPTTYVGGLGCQPARIRIEEADPIFAAGTFTPHPYQGGSPLLELISTSHALVGGQPSELLNPGYTKMPATTVRQAYTDQVYSRSVLVVHLDRLVGIEAFADWVGSDARYIIDYEERAEPDEPGYDGITATQDVAPFFAAVRRALGDLAQPGDRELQDLLRVMQGVSGRWAMQLLHRSDNHVRERLGLVAAVAALAGVDQILGTNKSGTTVILPLDEVLPRTPQRDVRRAGPIPGPQPDDPACDDLLLLHIPAVAEGRLTVAGAVTEVKYASAGSPPLPVARQEVENTTRWLEDVFNQQAAGRPFRCRDLVELIRSAAHRMATFGLVTRFDWQQLEASLAQIAQGEFTLDLQHYRGPQQRRGLIVSVEAGRDEDDHIGSIASTGASIDLLRLRRPHIKELLQTGKTPERSWTRLEFYPPDGPTTGVGTQPDPNPLMPEAGPGSAQDPGQPGDAAPWAAAGDGGVEEVYRYARSLDDAMARYRLECEPFDPQLADVGPNVIRLRTRTLGRTSIADIERRSRDISREVGAPGSILVTQEPLYVCIDVPRAERTSVPFPAVEHALDSSGTAGELRFVVGVSPSGDVRTADLARLPHLLVAGATGSGKSVFLRGLLTALVRQHSPQHLQLVIVDPKRLDFGGFSQVPHLGGRGIISDPMQAMDELTNLIEREIDARQPVLESAGASSVIEYYEQGGNPEEIPQIVLLVDEFADLVGVLERDDRRGFHGVIQRYAQITRAYGIYMVLATQRPSTDVVTGSIKANLTARIALSLPSHHDSMTILDHGGAEDLLGSGDMIFYHAGTLERVQGILTSRDDVERATNRWR